MSIKSRTTKPDRHYELLSKIPLKLIAQWRKEWIASGQDKQITFNLFRDRKMYKWLKLTGKLSPKE